MFIIFTKYYFDLTTVSFVRFPSGKKWYALSQMQKAHRHLQKVEGISFYKLMGSGAGTGFSIWPDFSVFCLLIEWDNNLSKDDFFGRNEFWQEYSGFSQEYFTMELSASNVKGTWNNLQPFIIENEQENEGPIAVLTRATIKKKWIPYFWSQVPKACAPVDKAIGHYFSKGVGEVPLLHQATVSIWKSKKTMFSYAYGDAAHLEMIKKTRALGWYKEELFSEFRIVKLSGFWNGKDMGKLFEEV